MAARTFHEIKPRRRNRRLSLTPLIDCVFILLVFFMLQTNFLRPHTMEFSKAAGVAGAANDMNLIFIELHDNGAIWLNGSATDIDSLSHYAAGLAAPGDARVNLGLDPAVTLQRAVDVMDLFNRHGISNISMTTARNFD